MAPDDDWHFEILRRVEWTHTGFCVLCGQAKRDGHNPSCDLGKLLASRKVVDTDANAVRTKPC